MSEVFRSKLLLGIFVLSTIANLAFLDLFIFHTSQISSKVASETVGTLALSQKPSSQVCPSSCLSEIISATSSVKLADSKTTPIIQSSPSREFYIPFGSGQSNAQDWTNVPGLQVYIDKTKYSTIKTVTFEAAVHIPTGNEFAQVQLYNVTAQHPVWNSAVYIEGGTPQLLTSPQITLDSGNNLYQVQMKTQLQYPAILDSARVHIITN